MEKEEIIEVIPITLSICLFGMIFGLIATKSGLTLLQSMSMSVFIFAGTAQFAMLTLINEHVTLISIVVTTLFINSRHLLMGLSLSAYYNKFSRRFANSAAFFLIDEQYAITLNNFRRARCNKRSIIIISLLFYGSWIVGTYIGVNVSDSFKYISTSALGFGITAMFLAISYSYIQSKVNVIIFLICGLLAILLYLLLPQGLYIVIVAGIAFGIGYVKGEYVNEFK